MLHLESLDVSNKLRQHTWSDKKIQKLKELVLIKAEQPFIGSLIKKTKV